MDKETKKEIIKNLIYTVKPRQTGGLLNVYSKDETDAKIKEVNFVLLGVILVLLVMVATLIIDSFHINSATYKEYSQKTESVEQTQKINKELLEQNKKNQELILEQQRQILQLLKK